MINDNDIHKLTLARSDKNRDIFIPEKSRYLNTLVIGTKNSGKTYDLLPLMAKQDMENKECGATFIVGKKDMAYFLYALAKKYKRQVHLLKPSTSIEADNLLWRESYDYGYVNDSVINYKEAIKKNHIVIIDMEYSKYRGRSLRATAMLLLQLQLDMQEWGETLKKPHFVYIDDSQYYLPFIEILLTNGEEYNVGTTLFIQSRSQFKQKDANYSPLLDNNVRSIILMNGLSLSDTEHYLKQFYEYKINVLMNRKQGQILYETVDDSNSRRNGTGELFTIPKELREEIEKKALGIKKSMTKKKRQNDRIQDVEGLTDVDIKTTEDIAEIPEQQTNPSDATETIIPAPEEQVKIPPKKAEPKLPVKSKPKSEPKKNPREIFEDNFNKNTLRYIICDINFDYDDEY